MEPRSGQFIGYRIVKLISKEPAGQRDLVDPRVQQAIREQLRDAEGDGDGQHWKHVRTPDGLEGYVPSTYTVAAPP